MQGEAEYRIQPINNTNEPLMLSNSELLKAVPLSHSFRYMPKLVSRTASITLLQAAHLKIIPFIRDLLEVGYRFYVTDQRRGYCYIPMKVITVPLWTFRETQCLRNWYLAHEVSHAFSPLDCMHGAEFMENLKRICPKESIHHELSYKPRNAIKAGIAYKIPADF